GTLKICDVATGEELSSFEVEPMLGDLGIAFGGGRVAAVQSRDAGTIRVWEMTSGKEIAWIGPDQGASHPALSKDGAWLAWVVGNGHIAVRHLARGKTRVINKPDSHPSDLFAGPHGELAWYDAQERVIHLHQASSVRSFRGLNSFPVGVAFAPEGRLLAADRD